MKNYLCITVFVICALLVIPTNLHAFKYGLGSCLDQRYEQSIWLAIKEKNIDGFIFLGDNVYGDHASGDLSKMKKAYKIQKTKLPKWLLNEKEILAIWDDHDFGVNDGGKDYPLKKEAEKMFLDFWNISNVDPRRNREGIYFKENKNIDGTEIEIIGLDTRYFRSKLKREKNTYKPNMDPEATILGEAQWNWLESSISNSQAKIVIILSSIQILATDHPYEKWANFPLERTRFLNLVSNASSNKTIIFISGDRHRAGIYQNKDFLEITASSLNKPGSKNKENDPLLLGQTFPEKNFGILDIEPKKNKITFSIHNQNGIKLNSKIINIPQ